MKSKNKQKMLTSTGTTCTNFYDCDSGKICKNGVCSACQTNNDCPTNMECADYDSNGFNSCYSTIPCNGKDLNAGDVCCNYKACSGECITDTCCSRDSIYHQTVNGKIIDYCCDTSNGYSVTDDKTKCCASDYLSSDKSTCLYCTTSADCSTGQTCSSNKCTTTDNCDPKCEGGCTDQGICCQGEIYKAYCYYNCDDNNGNCSLCSVNNLTYLDGVNGCCPLGDESAGECCKSALCDGSCCKSSETCVGGSCCSNEDLYTDTTGNAACCTNGVLTDYDSINKVYTKCCDSASTVTTGDSQCCATDKVYYQNNKSYCCSSYVGDMINGQYTTCCSGEYCPFSQTCCPSDNSTMCVGQGDNKGCCPTARVYYQGGKDPWNNGYCCATGFFASDYDGNLGVYTACCASSQVYTDTNGHAACCSGTVYTGGNGATACCSSTSQVYTDSGGKTGCCSGKVYQASPGNSLCCDSGYTVTTGDSQCCATDKVYYQNNKSYCCSSYVGDMINGQYTTCCSNEYCPPSQTCCPADNSTMCVGQGDNKGCCPTARVYYQGGKDPWNNGYCCATGFLASDYDGNLGVYTACCPSSQVYADTNGHAACCASSQVYTDTNGHTACCSGTVYTDGTGKAACCLGAIYKDAFGDNACCKSSQVYFNGMGSACCDSSDSSKTPRAPNPYTCCLNTDCSSPYCGSNSVYLTDKGCCNISKVYGSTDLCNGSCCTDGTVTDNSTICCTNGSEYTDSSGVLRCCKTGLYTNASGQKVCCATTPCYNSLTGFYECCSGNQTCSTVGCGGLKTGTGCTNTSCTGGTICTDKGCAWPTNTCYGKQCSAENACANSQQVCCDYNAHMDNGVCYWDCSAAGCNNYCVGTQVTWDLSSWDYKCCPEGTTSAGVCCSNEGQCHSSDGKRSGCYNLSTESCVGDGYICANNQVVNGTCCTGVIYTNSSGNTSCCNDYPGDMINNEYTTCCSSQYCPFSQTCCPSDNSTICVGQGYNKGCCPLEKVYYEGGNDPWNNGYCCGAKETLCFNWDTGKHECCSSTQACTVNGCGGISSGGDNNNGNACNKTSCPVGYACTVTGCCSIDGTDSGRYCNGHCCKDQACVFNYGDPKGLQPNSYGCCPWNKQEHSDSLNVWYCGHNTWVDSNPLDGG